MDDKQMEERPAGRPFRHVWAGLFLLLVGGVLLLDQIGFPLPDWLFTWQLLLIALGLFIGLKSNFRGGGWMIMILIGGFFLIEDHFPHFPLHRFLLPAFLIFGGLLIMIRPHRSYTPGRFWDEREKDHWKRKNWKHDWKHEWKHDWITPPATESGSASDYLDSTAIFSGLHRKIVSKNFKGGDVTSIMGGTEIDLTQADFTGTIVLDVTQVMGGTKIIVPGHWEVRSEVTAVFAGFEDKRQQPAVTNPDKILIIQGTSIMGGIELRNY
jgi:predicted membrane protein